MVPNIVNVNITDVYMAAVEGEDITGAQKRILRQSLVVVKDHRELNLLPFQENLVHAQLQNCARDTDIECRDGWRLEITSTGIIVDDTLHILILHCDHLDSNACDFARAFMQVI